MGFPDALLAADRLVTQQLGETVRCSLWGVDPWTDVVGVFTAQYVTASASDTGVISTSPALFARVSDLPGDPDGADEMQVQRADVQYRVRESHKDGDGGVLLLLQRID